MLAADGGQPGDMGAALAELWAEQRDTALERVAVLEDAAAALAAGTLDDQLREAARSAAHKLHGSAGTYGFHRASELAGELEDALAAGPVDGERTQQIAGIVLALRTELEGEQKQMSAKKILLIDDEQDIRAVSRMSLERVGGWQVLEAESGARGIELAEAEQPDAILLDAMMPGVDGPATIERLKATDATREIPVLFLTAKLQPSERERYLELGAVGVLAKPFDPMTLPDDVAELLGWPR